MRAFAYLPAVAALLISAPVFAQSSGGLSAPDSAAVRNTATHTGDIKTALGGKSDAAWSGTGDASVIAALKAQVAKQDAQLTAMGNQLTALQALLCKAAVAPPSETSGTSYSPSCTPWGAWRVALTAAGADVDPAKPSAVVGYQVSTGVQSVVNVGTTATQLFSVSSSQVYREICNNSAVTVWYGITNGVTTGNGVSLPALGQPDHCHKFNIPVWTGELWATVATGTAPVALFAY